MFSRIAAVSFLALPLLAAATPVLRRGDCNTGPIQCCQSTETAGSAAGSALLGLLGVVVQSVDVVLGLNCSPISVIGVGSGSACDASPVCCENNSVGGIISIGCVPIQL
uniref:Class I hydrophobin hgfII n=1 Tax=Grifola frondosa TaxID=5627 RepID=HGF2_GRIFR|nr:hydrophobin HGFII [Grifola frondosa]